MRLVRYGAAQGAAWRRVTGVEESVGKNCCRSKRQLGAQAVETAATKARNLPSQVSVRAHAACQDRFAMALTGTRTMLPTYPSPGYNRRCIGPIAQWQSTRLNGESLSQAWPDMTLPQGCLESNFQVTPAKFGEAYIRRTW